MASRTRGPLSLSADQIQTIHSLLSPATNYESQLSIVLEAELLLISEQWRLRNKAIVTSDKLLVLWWFYFVHMYLNVYVLTVSSTLLPPALTHSSTPVCLLFSLQTQASLPPFMFLISILSENILTLPICLMCTQLLIFLLQVKLKSEPIPLWAKLPLIWWQITSISPAIPPLTYQSGWWMFSTYLNADFCIS